MWEEVEWRFQCRTPKHQHLYWCFVSSLYFNKIELNLPHCLLPYKAIWLLPYGKTGPHSIPFYLRKGALLSKSPLQWKFLLFWQTRRKLHVASRKLQLGSCYHWYTIGSKHIRNSCVVAVGEGAALDSLNLCITKRGIIHHQSPSVACSWQRKKNPTYCYLPIVWPGQQNFEDYARNCIIVSPCSFLNPVWREHNLQLCCYWLW